MAETFNDRLVKLIKQRLDDSVQSEMQTMSAGGLKDHADYRYRAGRISGMRVAKEIIEIALTDIQKQ